MGTSNTNPSWSFASLDSPFQISLVGCLVAGLSYFAARLGGLLEILPQRDWPLWPANVLVVCALLLLPRRIWPLLIAAALGAFLAYNLQAGLTIRSILWLSLSDSVEILVAAISLRYVFHGVPKLNGLKALAKFSLFAGIIPPSLGALFGAAASNGNYWVSWRVSFFSEAIAYFTIMPAVLGWIGRVRSRRRVSLNQYLEVSALILAVISLSYFVFLSPWANTLPALPYLLVPFLLWSALRFGSAGAGAAASIVALVSVWGAAHGRGAFTKPAPIDDVLWLQLFLLSTAVPFMVLAALVEEANKTHQVLRESEKRFRLVADTAPVLIWMSGTDKMCSFFNKGWLNFTGRSMEDELGEGWVASVHPDDVQRCVEIYRGSFDARIDFEMEYRMRRFDGEYRWIVDYGVPRFESDSLFCGYIGSCVDITERKASTEALHVLTGRMIHVQEQERTRIARELHDDFAQRLALVGISLGHLWKSLPETNVEDRERVQAILKEIKELSSDLHSLSHQLHSSKLEHVGLVSALRGLCSEFSKKYAFEVQFLDRSLHIDIPKDVALCLFRVAQEALSNVIKHSQAKHGCVELGVNAHGPSLRIRDDGRGFDTGRANPDAGIGLIGMQERIRLVGGRLLLKSGPMQGTEVIAEVPLNISMNEVEAKAQTAGN